MLPGEAIDVESSEKLGALSCAFLSVSINIGHSVSCLIDSIAKQNY